MFDRFRARLLPLLRVPPEPQPPIGAPGSARVFRAARNYYRLRLVIWIGGQITTLAGIVFSLVLLVEAKRVAGELNAERKAAADAAHPAADPSSVIAPRARPPESDRRTSRDRVIRDALTDPHHPLGRLFERSPPWLFPLITAVEFGGIFLYLLQIPLTYAIVRLEFELRWYIVTDRSLRIRSGLVSMQETTMSFANVQQVTVSQGPLQRLFSIADVQVQSAGGGRDHGKNHEESMHSGVFHGVANAAEIRDLILQRLQLYRAAGLGDPDDHHENPATTPPATSAMAYRRPAVNGDILGAAAVLIDEAKALRRSASPAPRV